MEFVKHKKKRLGIRENMCQIKLVVTTRKRVEMLEMFGQLNRFGNRIVLLMYRIILGY